MKLHEEQRKAITHKEGPMMVLAGPGSGKTTVITHRVKQLITPCGVDPRHILVITFTKAAAGEMKQRFEKMMQEDSISKGHAGSTYPVSFGTFHAVFFQILKYAYGLTGAHILKEEQRYEIIRSLVEKYQIVVDDRNEFEQGILDEISVIKGEMMDVSHYYSKNCPEDTFRKLYYGYEEWLAREGRIDFDDMLVKCYELLSARPDVLAGWQKRYQYILIDEFQDINRIQYEVIKLLAQPENNLFIVGDDDQSIYRFRGAKPEIMLRFPKDYPNTKEVCLSINYRSTGNIVKAAEKVIRHNKVRYPKNITTNNAPGLKPSIQSFSDTAAETLRVVDEVKAYMQAGYAYSDIAFLFRTNMDARMLVERFMEYNIPFHVKDTLPNLYEHWIARDFISYMRIAMQIATRGDFLRVANKPNRYISRDAMKDAQLDFFVLEQFYETERPWMVKRIEEWEMQAEFISRMRPAAAIHYIRNAVGYDEYLVDYASYRRMEVEDLYDVAGQLEESAKEFKTIMEWFDHIDDYKEQLKQQAQLQNTVKNSIEISTIHSAKGLEYPIVYLLDVNEGVIPHQKAMLDEDMEEERRLFYVALTRAKERLHIYSVQTRFHKSVALSQFLIELQTTETS
jgi:DNA helicase-2/ATP-dependent DNA helicase PcrA